MNFKMDRTRVLFFSLLIWMMAAVVPHVQAMNTTWAAFQSFENGIMVWREDTGEILLFAHAGNRVYHFAETTYAYLPDNPALDTPPAGFVKPIRGFGRVWGNFPAMRALLGWATMTETGYTADIAPLSTNTGGFQITVPDGNRILVYTNNTWQWADNAGPITGPPVATTTLLGAVQAFERGYMIYANGTIWVLPYSGHWYVFDSFSYGTLAENPVYETPPPGYVKPILGFGKVWGHFPYVRAALGWALAPEQSYWMQIGYLVHSPGGYSWSSTYISLPGGQWVEVSSSGGWWFL